MNLYIKILCVSTFCSILSLSVYNIVNKNEKIDYQTKFISDSVSAFSVNNTTQKNIGTSSLPDLTFAASKTIDAVVHVKNTSIVEESDSWALQFFYGDDSKKKVGTGSGVIISPDGYIITNYHVIENSSEVIVTTNNNKEYEAEIIGFDEVTDIAVLKIDSNIKLDYIFFGDSDSTLIGEWVLAVGNPYNLNSTVTAGIVSSKSRDLNEYDQKNQSFIQTDAAVNFGNSGGALVNIQGELIGINTLIQSMTGGYVGYSFAVPSNIVKKVFEDLIEYGNVQKGLLGVSGSALNAELAEKFEVNETQGFLIGEVIEGMGASEAGLKSGDIIKKVDNVKINSFSDLTGYLSTKRPGKKVQVIYSRDGVKDQITVTLMKTNSTQFLGMYLKNINSDEKEYFKLENGVIIKDLANQRLYRYGIDEGFILLEINNKKIKNVADVDAFDFENLSSILFLKPNGERERIVFE